MLPKVPSPPLSVHLAGALVAALSVHALALQIEAPPIGSPGFAGSCDAAEVQRFAVGDIDSDGWPDWVGAQSALLTVARNNGRGLFSLETMEIGGATTSLAIGDLDGDGKPDLLTLHEDTGLAAVRLGDGLGHFPGEPLTSAAGILPQHASLADFDLDGDLDLLDVPLSSVGEVLVGLNAGSGTFTGPVAFSAVPASAKSALAGDVTGDGVMDAVVLGSGGKVVFLAGGAQGILGSSKVIGVFTAATKLQLGDVNGDGTADVATLAGATGQMTVSVSAGAGAFLPAFTLADAGATDAALGDVNGDDRSDLVSMQVTGVLTAHLSAPDGEPGPAITTTTAQTGLNWISLPDVDLDGWADVLGFDAQHGRSFVWRASGSGTFVTRTDYSLGLSSSFTYYVGVELCDLSGDGVLDLLALILGKDVLWRQGDGAGGFGEAHVTPLPDAVNGETLSIGDTDDDGDLDVLLRDDLDGQEPGDFPLALLTNTGSGEFAAPQEVPGLAHPSAAILADISGDGRDDVVAADSETVLVDLATASGFGPFIPIEPVKDATDLGLGDLDADGDLDLVVSTTAGFSVLWHPADGGHVEDKTTVTAPSCESPSVADLNEDGLGDIVCLEPGEAISVSLGAAGHAFQPLASLRSAQARHVRASDFDGDGHMDLAVAIDSPAQVRVLHGNGQAAFPAASGFGLYGSGWRVACGDLDADGWVDIVVGTDHVLSALVNLRTELDPWASVGGGLPGSSGPPHLDAMGPLEPGESVGISLVGARPLTPTLLVASGQVAVQDFKGGTLVPGPPLLLTAMVTDSGGALTASGSWPAGLPSLQSLLVQCWQPDVGAVHGWAASGTMLGVAP